MTIHLTSDSRPRAAARRFSRLLAGIGREPTHGRSLDLGAAAYGFPDWRTLATALGRDGRVAAGADRARAEAIMRSHGVGPRVAHALAGLAGPHAEDGPSGLSGLGYDRGAEMAFAAMGDAPDGSVSVICGPTGAAKTTVLAHVLPRLSSPTARVSVVSEFVEVAMTGVTQHGTNDAPTSEGRERAWERMVAHAAADGPDVLAVDDLKSIRQAAAFARHCGLGRRGWLVGPGFTGHMAYLAMEGGVDPARIHCVVNQRRARGVCPRCAVPAADARPDGVAWTHGDLFGPRAVARSAAGCGACVTETARRREPVLVLTDVHWPDRVMAIVRAGFPWSDDMGFVAAAHARVARGAMAVGDFMRMWCPPGWPEAMLADRAALSATLARALADWG